MKTCPKCALTYPNERSFCFLDGTDLVELPDPRIGSTLAGRYVIDGVLGEGGMATVYAAHHTLVERQVAIKVMSPMFARDSVVRERFRREAKSAQSLAHPNVIEIYEQGETDDGTSFIVMEQLVGSSLAGLISQGAIPIPRAVGLMIQMARGIARAHDLDVIHRDLKPENIFVVRAERGGKDVVKLLDFGIARSMSDTRLTGQGELFGTPQYMAPERISNADAGPPADLYALGIIFFEMVTGRLPFESPDIASFFVKHLKEVPERPRNLNPLVPQELEDLILRLMAKDPKARPVDAHRVHQDLVELAQAHRIPVPVDPQSDPAVSSPRPASTLRALEPTRWAKRTEVFAAMLARAYGGTPPQPAAAALAEMKEFVARMLRIGEETLAVQEEIESVAERGREGRQRFGFAVDALGVDLSRAKDEERVASEEVVTRAARVTEAQEGFKTAQAEVVRWEGRSAFLEPYTDLSAAYRGAADRVDAWRAARASEKEAKTALEARTRAVGDIEFQVRELRAALAAHEEQVERVLEDREQRIRALTEEADGLDRRLGELLRRFADPLRGRPELTELFRDLETAA